MALDLSTLGAGLTDPVAKVVNNFIDKIGSAIGWIAKPHGIKEAKVEAQKSIIHEIAGRDDLNPVEKYAIIDNIQEIVKKYKNKNSIVEQAIYYLEPTADPEKMDNDWLSFFFDKAGIISDKQMQIIWSKILAGEANKPGKYSKHLLHILSIMNIDDSNSFTRLIPFCMNLNNERIIPFIYYRKMRDFEKVKKYYEENKISYRVFILCQRLGLIIFNERGFNCSTKNADLYYDKYEINLLGSNNILYGNVAFTPEGSQLYEICEKLYLSDLVGSLYEIWESYDYKIKITKI